MASETLNSSRLQLAEVTVGLFLDRYQDYQLKDRLEQSFGSLPLSALPFAVHILERLFNIIIYLLMVT